MKDYLIRFNKLRNEYTHRIKFKPDLDLAHKIAREAKEAGIYFKDDRIFGRKPDAEKIYNIKAILFEVIINTFQEILFTHKDLFSKDEVNELMISKKPHIVLK
jgi:hypothetical protein